MTRLVRWLHLSDIHFRAKSKLDQKDAFTRVRADLVKRKTEGRCPDLIFITGDITHSGQTAADLILTNHRDTVVGLLPFSCAVIAPETAVDHGRFNEITQSEVVAMVIGVRGFIERRLPS